MAGINIVDEQGLTLNHLKRGGLVVGIPAYNEEGTIANVVVRTMKFADKVIVCDDGSTDMTGEIAEALGVEVIRHETNRGYGAALATLFRRARDMNLVAFVTLDADAQHNPEDIPRLVAPILRGEANIVVGSRFQGEDDDTPGFRRIGIKVITKLTNAVSYHGMTDAQSGLRAYSKQAVQLLKPTEQGMGASTELLIDAENHGLTIREIPVTIHYEVAKPSQHNLFYHGFDVVLSTVKHASIKHPLLFYGLPGLAAILVAFVFWVWTFQIFAATQRVITNITLVAIGSTLVGLMLLTTSIILWVLISVVREIR